MVSFANVRRGARQSYYIHATHLTSQVILISIRYLFHYAALVAPNERHYNLVHGIIGLSYLRCRCWRCTEYS